GVRVVRSAMVAGGVEYGSAARPPGQERLAERASPSGRRNPRLAPPTARTGGVLARLHDRARRADDGKGVPRLVRQDWYARQDAISDPSPHVEARLRLRVGQCRS